MPDLYRETVGPVDLHKPHHIRLRFSRVWDADRLNMAQNILTSTLDDEAKLSRLAGIFGPLAHNLEITQVTETEYAIPR